MTTSIRTVNWTMTLPAGQPRCWSRLSLPAGWEREADKDRDIEVQLQWPPGTVTYLRSAFAQGFRRGVGWDEAGMAVDSAAAEVASRVFQRGVGYRRELDGYKPREVSGSYPIVMDTSVDSSSNSEDAQTPPVPPKGSWVVLDGQVQEAWRGRMAWTPDFVTTLNEHTKVLESVASLIAAYRQAYPQASAGVWTVVGGGLLADVAVFAAGLVGAAVHLVPTTLLAMADACIGGKCGVNFPPYGKNQVGLFYFPKSVHIWPGWLQTLPPRHWHAGGSECLKHAFLVGDQQLARQLATALAAERWTALAPLLPAVVDVKARIVAADPGEVGERATLNFGHTMGHALEAFSQANTVEPETLLHGEAVALGMVFALVLSERAAGLDRETSQSMITMLQRSGGLLGKEKLARRLGIRDLRAPQLLTELRRLIGHDKKNSSDSAHTSQWILLERPGQVARESRMSWAITVYDSEIDRAWQAFLKTLS